MHSAPFDLHLKRLYPTDILTIALALIFALLSFLNCGKVTSHLLGITLDTELLYGVLFLLISVLLPVVFRWVNPLRNRVVQFFRLFYPQIVYLLFYQQAIALSQLFYNGRSFDSVFAGADRAIFGFEPAVRFHELFAGTAIVNELFFFGYFSFFALITVGWWVMYGKGDVAAASRAFAIVTLSFYVLYLFYAFFPVEGPKYYFPSLHREWYGHFKGYLFTFVLKVLFDNVNLAGAAFPSSHVIISSVSLLLNLRHNPRIGIAFLPITILLYFSTVYLYAHYAVDVFAGLVVAVLFWWLIPQLIRRSARFFETCDSLAAAVLRLPPIAAYRADRPATRR